MNIFFKQLSGYTFGPPYVWDAFCVRAALAGPGNPLTSAQKELQLIQSKSDIENPRIIVEALPLVFRTYFVCDRHSNIVVN